MLQYIINKIFINMNILYYNKLLFSVLSRLNRINIKSIGINPYLVSKWYLTKYGSLFTQCGELIS